jgi:hypothetical protein
MSLCPNYCECEPCPHGYKLCDGGICRECEAIYQRKLHQKAHEESVRRQKMKIKIAPWRLEQDNG